MGALSMASAHPELRAAGKAAPCSRCKGRMPAAPVLQKFPGEPPERAGDANLLFKPACLTCGREKLQGAEVAPSAPVTAPQERCRFRRRSWFQKALEVLLAAIHQRSKYFQLIKNLFPKLPITLCNSNSFPACSEQL